MSSRKKPNLTSWGRHPRIVAQGRTFETDAQLQTILAGDGDWIAYGMGKSYGDSALNANVVFTRRFNKILAFDPASGLVTCESGVSLAEIIDIFLPRGWFLAITPGTKLITVGGAVASDVHGKNHHVAGCFSQCVTSMDLMLPDGRIVTCNRSQTPDLFRATCGGMGLTGVILTVTFHLQRVNSAYIRETVVRSTNLSETFDLFEQYQSMPYSVAWIDCLAAGRRQGRGAIMVGRHAGTGPRKPPPEPRLSVPFTAPGFCLNRYSVAVFNQIVYSTRPKYVENRLVPIDAFFYPLDKVAHWNRMYGRNGFTQYQFVLPKSASAAGLQRILTRIAEAGLGSFLAVLKLCGPQNDNLISFPMEGYSLALDFKIEPKLFPLLDELDRMVLDHGGRIYLTKDVRMPASVFRQGYPQWERFAQIREALGGKTKFNSLQSKRLGV